MNIDLGTTEAFCLQGAGILLPSFSLSAVEPLGSAFPVVFPGVKTFHDEIEQKCTVQHLWLFHWISLLILNENVFKQRLLSLKIKPC